MSQLINPNALFLMAWAAVCGLYSLKISSILIYEMDKLLEILVFIVPPFLIAGYLVGRVTTQKNKNKLKVDLKRTSIGINRWLFCWILFTIVEIIYSKGVPIIWLFLGDSKTYFDFGIPTVHGILNSLIFSLSFISIFLFIQTRLNKYLIPSVILFVWSVCIVSRQMFMVEGIGVLLLLTGIYGRKIIRKIIITSTTLLLFFGILGNLRSGSDHFSEVAQVEVDGTSLVFLWPYMYVTTPINNLMYNVYDVNTTFNYTPYATTISLFPSFIRGYFYPEFESKSWILPKEATGELLIANFNVSTAFISTYLDFGVLGIIMYSSFLGAISMYYWRKSSENLYYFLTYILVATCLVLSVFYNSLFSLPLIFQIIFYKIVIKVVR